MSWIIFDFDGTLVDSYACMVAKFTHLADEFNFTKIPSDKIESLRDLSSMEIIRFLNIPFYKLPLIIRAARRLLRDAMPALEPINGLPDVIKTLANTGHQLGIVTSNSIENVECWLVKQNLQRHFQFIQSESRYFSKNKLLRKVFKKYKMNAKEVWYIGDETRDIEAGREAGCKTIAVSWGYNSVQALQKHNPDVLIATPRDLIKHLT